MMQDVSMIVVVNENNFLDENDSFATRYLLRNTE